MKAKRLTLFAGHYGSGKTNIAVNYAFELCARNLPVIIADLDIVNPYFRTKDSEAEFIEKGIELVCSSFTNSNLDIPALPQEMYKVVQNKSKYGIIDIGGDDQGAVALGRYVPYILEENDYDMLFVANCFRPLTTTPEDTITVMREIEAACGIKFTGIVNNSNLGNETTSDDVIMSLEYIKKISDSTGLPVVMNCVKADLYGQLLGKVDNLFSLTLQTKYFDINTGGI